MFPKGDRWPGIRHLHGLLAATGREAERQRAVEKEAGDGFPASTDHARAGGAKDAAGPAAEDHWPSRKGQLTMVTYTRLSPDRAGVRRNGQKYSSCLVPKRLPISLR